MLELSLDEVLERFEAEYVAERKGVEEPDPLLVDAHSWLVALRAVRDAGLAAQKAMVESTALCPLCQGEPDEHAERCPLGALADALAATTEEPGEDARVGVTDAGRAAISRLTDALEVHPDTDTEDLREVLDAARVLAARLNVDDGDGKPCPVCGDTEAHFDDCELSALVNALDHVAPAHPTAPDVCLASLGDDGDEDDGPC